MMRKILAFALIMSGMACFAQSEKVDMKSILRSMPEDVFPLLTHNNVLDFIDFLDSKMKAEVDNRLGGRSEMTTLTDSTCHIRLTSASEAYVRLVPKGDRQQIVVTHIYTAGDTKSPSTTEYTLDWKKLNN